MPSWPSLSLWLSLAPLYRLRRRPSSLWMLFIPGLGLQMTWCPGQSTFMVEMMEANNAIRQATPALFILFDELGRGRRPMMGWLWLKPSSNTSMTGQGPKRSFATHYHELTDLSRPYLACAMSMSLPWRRMAK